MQFLTLSLFIKNNGNTVSTIGILVPARPSSLESKKVAADDGPGKDILSSGIGRSSLAIVVIDLKLIPLPILIK